jgi:hypothetical protein
MQTQPSHFGLMTLCMLRCCLFRPCGSTLLSSVGRPACACQASHPVFWRNLPSSLNLQVHIANLDVDLALPCPSLRLPRCTVTAPARVMKTNPRNFNPGLAWHPLHCRSSRVRRVFFWHFTTPTRARPSPHRAKLVPRPRCPARCPACVCLGVHMTSVHAQQSKACRPCRHFCFPLPTQSTSPIVSRSVRRRSRQSGSLAVISAHRVQVCPVSWRSGDRPCRCCAESERHQCREDQATLAPTVL